MWGGKKYLIPQRQTESTKEMSHDWKGFFFSGCSTLHVTVSRIVASPGVAISACGHRVCQDPPEKL